MDKKHQSKNLNKEEVKKILKEKNQDEISKFKELDIVDDFDYKQLHYKEGKGNVLSLFSGCGGLDLGVELAGLEVNVGEDKTNEYFKEKELYFKERRRSVFHFVYSNDNFKEANESYLANFPKQVFKDDRNIRKIPNFPKSDIVLGGFPCPGFSVGGPRLIDDERNFLYLHYVRCLMQSKPKFFIAENVKGLLTLGKGEVVKQVIEDFSSAGYNVFIKLLNSRDYGVPQLRERVFIVGVRKDIDFTYEFPKPTHGKDVPYVSLKEAIGDLENNAGDYYEGSFSSIYLSRNRKKGWNEPSFTIQASGRQAPLHPSGEPMKKVGKDKWELPHPLERHRRLSVKEIARIQTFPDWYYFSQGDNSEVKLNTRLDKQYKQIGNAVPVLMAKHVAKPIAEWFKQNS